MQGNYGLCTFVAFSSLTQMVVISYCPRSTIMVIIHVFRLLSELIRFVVSVLVEGLY